MSDVLEILKNESIRGVVVRHGSLVDHPAMLLNGRSIQLAVAPDFPSLLDATLILIDGLNDRIVVASDMDALTRIAAPPVEDGARVWDATSPLEYNGRTASVHVDASNPSELKRGIENGAIGIGILRTDWLGWDHQSSPETQLHAAAYFDAVAYAHPHRLNIRLFDIGGDKIPRWAASASSEVQSPLGFRGVRALHLLPDAFNSQLSAICQVAAKTQVGLVIPMVTDVEDIRTVKRLLARSVSEPVAKNIVIGAMVEVPAAALEIRHILEEADFVRIGPGDLSQFTLARLRSQIPPTAFSRQTMHPAVLKLVGQVASACREVGKPVSICLDLEPSEVLLSSLLRQGVETFCVSSSAVAIVRRRLYHALRSA
jgi:phosphoenolpyruvate-protein kinase (PTS system EI component)